MHPSFLVSVVALAAPALDVPAPAADPYRITEREYATLMASMSACRLDLDMAAVGKFLVDAGINPTNQERAEALGALVWEEGQRVYLMGNAEQARHCADMHDRARVLGLTR